ncbi:MAG TPA: methylmalonyl-CoA mutase family protein, partial [Pyrinomonadaceae bacterium]
AVVVGVNRFQSREETTVPTLRVEPAIEQQQMERVRAVRFRRDAAATETALAKLEEAARGTESLLPRILECVEAHATVGEISKRFRNVWGEYKETSTV